MPSFLSRLRKESLGSGVKSDLGKIERPEEYYQLQTDLRKNLLLFEKEISKIKEQYIPYSFEYAFNVEFKEPLSPEDFYYPEKIEDYCRRNKVSPEKLKKFRQERLKIREKASNEILHRITLAKAMLLIRDNCCPEYLMERAVTFEKIYGEPQNAAEFKKLLAITQTEKSKGVGGV